MSALISSELRWLAKWVRPYLRWHIGSFLSISIGSMLALFTPLILKWLIDDVLPARRAPVLMLAIVLIFLCHVSRALFTAIANYLTSNAVQRLSLDLRIRVLKHFDTLSASYYENTPVGEAMYPLQEPIDEIAYFGSDLVPAILRTFMGLTFTLAIMVILNPRMTLALVPLIPLFVVTRIHFTDRLDQHSESVQNRQRQWNSFMQEHLASITCIQLLRKENRQERQAFRLLARRVKSYDKLFRTGGWFTLVTSLSIALGMSTVIGYGGWSVLTGSLSVGGLVAFYAYVVQLFDPLSGAAETYIRAKKTFASIRQVQSVFALKADIRDCPAAIHFTRGQAMDIELQGIRFGYSGGREQIALPYLNIEAGTHLTIAGENGAGKSTLAKLLVRLYDVDAGAILCAGHDIREIEIQNLREHICFAPCNPVLFDTSLEGNLRLGRSDARDAEIHEVIQTVGLTDFIAELPRGLAEPIGPGGCQLSGGQRQRIGLARCILQRPSVLILDEATSSLDEDSEREILYRLKRTLCGTTIITISHRLSAITSAEHLIVMKAGVIARDNQEDRNADGRPCDPKNRYVLPSR
jgi:ABC-type multidrug transport system fused ATPase/permease subunit